jgi:ATPase subunit of ABC transporter with duplicated ATPase domains
MPEGSVDDGTCFHRRARSTKSGRNDFHLQAQMIRLDNVSKQVGHQILFIEASAALQKGEKIGLVGPNGAGKSKLFRMIAGEEQPDEGQVSVDRGVTIGYFSQDVGEMAGRSALAEVMDGAGPVSIVASELKELEAAMADPDRADEMDEIITRYGEVQGRFEELDGYALEGRAREALAGLGFSQEMMDGDVGALSGGWKMRVALARILLMRPDVMLLDEPSNHLDLESLIWLEQFLKGYEGALLMTSHDREFINRIINKVVEIDGGTLSTYSGDYEFYEAQRALNEKQQQAQFERQQAMLAKEIKFIERFKARASHAAQVQSRVKKLDKIERVEPPRRRQTVARISAGAALGRGRRQPEERPQGLRQPQHLSGAGFHDPPQGALVRHGHQRRGEIDAVKAGGGFRRA